MELLGAPLDLANVSAAVNAYSGVGASLSPKIALSVTEVALAVLKFAGLVVGVLSTVWGLTQKLTVEDEQGRKRLTGAGKAALSLALGAFFVSAAAASVELISLNLKNQNALLAADAERDAKELERQEKERTAKKAEETRRGVFEGIALSRIEAARRESADSAQRLLDLENAARAEARDAALARDINLGTAANLQRSEKALSQLERVLQPLGPLDIEMTFSVPVPRDSPLGRLATRAAADPAVLEGMAGLSARRDPCQRLQAIQIESDSPHYPNRDDYPELVLLLGGSSPIVAFQAEPPPVDNPLAADIGTHVYAGQVDLVYDIASSSIEFTAKRGAGEVSRTGRIVSVLDLQKATLVVAGDTPPKYNVPFRHDAAALARLHASLRLVRGEVATSGQSWSFDEYDVASDRLGKSTPLFRVQPVGSPMQVRPRPPARYRITRSGALLGC